MLLAFLLALQTASAREAPPVLQFPTPGLDDSAAYEGYTARLYRDSHGNSVEIYIDGKIGRVVHLWADALNESIGFTVRNSGGQEATPAVAAVAFAEGPATVWSTGGRGGRRGLRYRLTVRGGRSIQIGQILLGSMRVERDFGYAGRVRDPIDAPTFVVPELAQFAAKMGSPYTDRLTPSVVLINTASRWTVRASQPSLDGKNHLWLTLSGDAQRSRATLTGRVVTIRPLGRQAVPVSVEIATDGPPLSPLDRAQIFSNQFRHFADSANSPRIEREIRGFELLSSRQKLMAGLPTYATYFGRDMLMTALLMEPVWSDTMPEFVMGAALAKLAPDGEVSHEEALGGQAIRENVAEFLKTGDRSLLRDLQRTRELFAPAHRIALWLPEDGCAGPAPLFQHAGLILRVEIVLIKKSLAVVLVADDHSAFFKHMKYGTALIDACDDGRAPSLDFRQIIIRARIGNQLAVERFISLCSGIKSRPGAGGAGAPIRLHDLHAKRLPAPAHQIVIGNVVTQEQQD